MNRRLPMFARLFAVIVLASSGLLALAAADEFGAVAPEAMSDFEAAVQAYGKGDYPRALELFSAAAEEEADATRRSILHANAGTAAARAELLGEAVWQLEAAWRAKPGDLRVQRNLEQVRARLGVAGEQSGDFLNSVASVPLQISQHQMDTTVGLVLTAAIVLLICCRVGMARGRTGWAALSLGLVAVGLALGTEAARGRDARRAVVILGTSVRSEPNEGGSVLFRLDPGTVVLDEELREGWRLVETTAGARGWAPEPRVRAAGGRALGASGG